MIICMRLFPFVFSLTSLLKPIFCLYTQFSECSTNILFIYKTTHTDSHQPSQRSSPPAGNEPAAALWSTAHRCQGSAA